MQPHPEPPARAGIALALEAVPRLLEQSLAFLTVVDSDGLIRYADPFIGRVLCCDPASLIGEHFLTFTPVEDAEAAREFLATVMARPGQHGPVIGRARKGDGGFVWIETVFDSSDMAGAGLRMLSRDITDRVGVEEALHSRLLEAQRFEALGRLAGGVAHDLNNLLTVISGYSTLLMAQLPAGSPDQLQAEDVQLASEHAAELVRQLHRLGRAGAGEVRGAELGDQVERLRSLISRALGVNGRFQHERRSTVVLSFDSSSLGQSLLLLAVWLRQARPEGAEFRVSTDQCSLEAAHAAQLDLAPGPYAVLRVEIPDAPMRDEGVALVTSGIAGILSRAGGGMEFVLRSDNLLRVQMYWPLAADAARAHDPDHPLVTNAARLAALWRPLIAAP